MKEEELQNAVLLVFANKQDLPNAFSVAELTEKLALQNFKARKVSLYVFCNKLLLMQSELLLPILVKVLIAFAISLFSFQLQTQTIGFLGGDIIFCEIDSH